MLRTALLSLLLSVSAVACIIKSGSGGQSSSKPPVTTIDHRTDNTATPHDPGDIKPGTDGNATDSPAIDGASCFVDTDCQSGICEGMGCGADAPGTCAPQSRACTKDLATYCGCDGQEFHGSGSCPGKRYASRGRCP